MKSDIVISLLTTLVGLAWTLFFLHLNNIGGVFEGGLIGGVGLTLFGVALSNTERK